MEKSSASATFPAPPFPEPLGFLLFFTNLTWSISKLQRLLLPKSSQSCNNLVAGSIMVFTDEKIKKTPNNHKDEIELTSEDVEAIVGKMGLSFSQEGDRLEKIISSDWIYGLFEEEPSLEEVKQAFSVFDENGDGFIDAVELHRILQNLGLGDGIGLHECEQMIGIYDLNKDMRIDFIEFTKLLEIGIC